MTLFLDENSFFADLPTRQSDLLKSASSEAAIDALTQLTALASIGARRSVVSAKDPQEIVEKLSKIILQELTKGQ